MLLHLPGVGRKTILRAIRENHSPSIQSAVDRLCQKASNFDLQEATSHANRVVHRSAREKIHIISIFDDLFPTSLRAIDDPPLLLHVKGDLNALANPNAVAVIGTREPTAFGVESARRIASSFARARVTVVSGLALGCDTAAHAGCLSADGTTVAVMAHGLDKVYPAENKPLAAELLAKGGCLVSEYEIGQRAFRTSFVERDRIQSGLAKAVVVVETGVTGGSMHTVRFARAQHRIVACLRHPPAYADQEKTFGNKKLIEEGQALPLASSIDVDSLIKRVTDTSTQASEQPAIPPPSLREPPGQLSFF